YYLGNQGFFWGIFRDITPLAARQAVGWEFRGFSGLAFRLGFRAWFSAFGFEAQSDSSSKRRSRVRSAYREKVSAAFADQDS
ncbi:MAG: hypothetical protein WA804_02490, partial [Terriglobales bacterium]